MRTPNVKEVIRQKYGQAALGVESEAGCCGDRPSVMEASCDPITSNLYDPAQKDELPDTAIKASLGCGNPTALAELKPGEVVLDLGSGGGIDVLLSAYNVDDARTFLSNKGVDVDDLARQVGGKFISAFVRATKPATVCRAPSCCS